MTHLAHMPHFDSLLTLSQEPAQFVEAAWHLGRTVDIADVGYGQIHWDNQQDILVKPMPYYRFLAGVAYLIKAKSALDIGTHCGGSALALARGMKKHFEHAKLVTVDTTAASDDYLPARPENQMITKLVGDANSPEIIKQVQATLGRVDLLFIDAERSFMSTFLCFSTYVALLRPKAIVLIDVLFTEDMTRFWEMAQKPYPGRSINCLDVRPEIRAFPNPPPFPGFGLILPTYPAI